MSAVKLIVPDAGSDFSTSVLDRLGKTLDLYTCFPTDVIVAKFQRTHLGTSGKLLAAPATSREDRWQGKVGLVIKLGNHAFHDDSDASFFGFSLTVGNWAVYRNTDGFDFDICIPGTTDRIECRRLKDGEVFGKVQRPDLIW